MNRLGQTFIENTDGTTVVIGYCILTNKKWWCVVPTDGLNMWRRGYVKIQDAMPLIPADIREFLMSGSSPEAFKEEFGEHEIRIEVLGGVVTSVSGLPDGWTYELVDWDNINSEVHDYDTGEFCFDKGDDDEA